MATETPRTNGATEAPQRPADSLLSMLAERIPARLGASAVYGAPVERDGVTVVPVATARFGIGAGGGSDDEGQQGEGGGGGGMTTPVGYIELKEGRSRFVPIVHPARMLGLMCGTILAGLVLLRPLAARRQRSSVMPWR